MTGTASIIKVKKLIPKIKNLKNVFFYKLKKKIEKKIVT